jgi:hypothetical protein
MSNQFLRHLLPLGGAMLFSLTAAMPARADTGADAYACHVVGDSSACAKLPAQAGSETTTQVTAGSYGRYLIHLGRTPDQAIAEARAIGEEPTVRIVSRDGQRHLSDFEAYERFLGRGNL